MISLATYCTSHTGPSCYEHIFSLLSTHNTMAGNLRSYRYCVSRGISQNGCTSTTNLCYLVAPLHEFDGNFLSCVLFSAQLYKPKGPRIKVLDFLILRTSSTTAVREGITRASCFHAADLIDQSLLTKHPEEDIYFQPESLNPIQAAIAGNS